MNRTTNNIAIIAIITIFICLSAGITVLCYYIGFNNTLNMKMFLSPEWVKWLWSTILGICLSVGILMFFALFSGLSKKDNNK